MLETDYTENLFRSIDTIIAERIKRLPYDITVIAKIIDDSNAMNGIYRVTQDGNYSYIVYSDNPYYKEDDEVYITTLGGDTRKFINGMYMQKDGIHRINRLFEKKED